MATTLRFQIRGDTAESWSSKNTKLLAREIGYDSTNRRLKVGDGKSHWNDLPFLPPDVIDDLTTGGNGNALSAEQGKVLYETKAEKSALTQLENALRGLINQKADITTVTNLQSTLTNLINKKADKTELTTLETNLTTQINNSKVSVINKIASNNSSTAALSAYQGYVLQTNIDKKLAQADVTSESWTFTLEDGSTVTKKVMLSTR